MRLSVVGWFCGPAWRRCCVGGAFLKGGRMIDKLADAAAQSGAVGMLEADLGSGSSETFATPTKSAATGGDLNPASILAQATATGGDVTGGSASLVGTTVQLGVAGGLVFNI